MTNLNRPARLNRVVLGLLGLALLAGGGFALATHFGRLRVLDPASPLVPGTALPPTWTLYATAAVAVVLGLLVLRWLLAQPVRGPRTHPWRFDDPGGRTELPAAAAVAPLTEELRTYPGVRQARATLAGTRLALVVSLERDGDPAAVRERLAADGLPRLCQALELDPDSVAVSVEFRFTGAAGSAVA